MKTLENRFYASDIDTIKKLDEKIPFIFKKHIAKLFGLHLEGIWSENRMQKSHLYRTLTNKKKQHELLWVKKWTRQYHYQSLQLGKQEYKIRIEQWNHENDDAIQCVLLWRRHKSVKVGWYLWAESLDISSIQCSKNMPLDFTKDISLPPPSVYVFG